MLTRDHVIWAYRMLLDREVESDQAIDTKVRAWKTTQELRMDIMASPEFGLKNPEHAASQGPRIVIKPFANGTRLFVDLSDHVIGRPLVREEYETSEVAFATSVVGAGDVALDIGAHIGWFTIQLAHAVGATGHVYAFEPLPRNADLLEQSVAENGFQERTTLERAAVANSAGEATLRFAAASVNTGGAFLSQSGAGIAGLSSLTVRTIALDGYACRRPVRLLKIDVEGAEPAVIDGAASLIARDQPVIVTEIHPEQLRRVSGSTPEALIAQIGSLGLRPHRIVNGRLASAISAADIHGVCTVAFTPAGMVAARESAG